MTTPKHLIHFDDFDIDTHRHILARAHTLKSEKPAAIFAGRFLLMLFTYPSTRTRVSFASAMTKGGGGYQVIDGTDSQIKRGESLADTARAISAICDAVAIRTQDHDDIMTFANHASCPVINALSNKEHPCQVIADILTYEELRGNLRGRKIAWLGDFNNVMASWTAAARLFDCQLTVACPAEYHPPITIENTKFTTDAIAAATNADLVMTDVWTSIGCADEENSDLAAYSVNEEIMAAAAADALFMHCLPAWRGKEVSASVIDGKQSAVWQQAENRLHAQRALLEYL